MRLAQDRDDAIDDRIDPALLDAARDQEHEAQRPSVGHPCTAIEPDRERPTLVVLAKVPVVAVLDEGSPHLLVRLSERDDRQSLRHQLHEQRVERGFARSSQRRNGADFRSKYSPTSEPLPPGRIATLTIIPVPTKSA